ncbi:universal stress protein [Auraticoccus sp. F435]|uniref:Universal stress protein n=1 Tax=Auraticoccus cholistanensis TaxID=2656650 RepID=A0A6A9UWT9_9ACTN|nr:universal stress protein [Auraticoccus cholistanensis]MVA75687.1 universal stress protein [Auraticoccus cholistanensis]
MSKPLTHRVVVGVDGSDDGQRALVYAVRAALAREADLLIAHAVDDAVLAGAWGVVYDPTLLQQAGESIVDEAVETARSMGLPAERVHREVAMGNPSGVLAKLSETADLVVVGRRSVRGLERLFVGSTSVGVAASARCPVIMVSAASHVEHTGFLGRIGIGLEPNPKASGALRMAFEEAERRGATLEVVHAWQPPTVGLFSRTPNPEKLQELRRRDAEHVQELVERLRREHPGVEVEVLEVDAHPVDTLVTRSADLDLLWLGVHEGGLGVGAVVRGVMAHSRCPLALVRACVVQE